MDASTQPAIKPHRNHGLFSDHYLDHTLPGRDDWAALAAEAGTAMEEIARVFASYAPSENEAQVENDLVRPVMELLGYDYEVQPALATPEGTKRPDYVLYRDAASLVANKGRTLDDALLRGNAFAVGDAKYWDRPLDASLKKGKKGDAFTNKNPSFQISFYMQHAGVEWGILTNGRLWRLYHRGSAHKLDRFYEVDLHALATGGDARRFLYFYTFFRRAAFEDQPLGVGAMLAESVDYARNIGDSLKAQVYEALRHLAQGFLDHPKNGLGTDQETLRGVYDNSLIVLYRLLFILYAESRGLLPVRESAMYRDDYGLYAIKHDVERNLTDRRALLPTSATLWPRLTELFGIIDRGSPPLKVATFNGGLFNPERHPFLEEYAVGDGHLQEAIDRLARVKGQFVDYRDLAERHLGTIYEGLLEYHLEALAEPEEGWTVSLLNDKGERRATGSYYTPDYVVKYIVEATVGPVLREAVGGAETDGEKVEAVLALNVLDPAMGSVHFLVEVTEYVARFLVELGVGSEGEDAGAELAYWKRRVAQSCVYGVDANPLAVDLAKLSLWLRAGYGEPLRGYFAAEGALREILDFGHAPIFPDADVFPCIVVLEKPREDGERGADGAVRVFAFPREALGKVDLAAYVSEHAHAVPKKRFGASAWSLESSAVDDLMQKVRENGVPLADYAGVKPYRGVLTGLNEAFLIDTATRERLVREDARSAEVIKPYLRGQDIKRWSPEWRGLWMIFARRGIDLEAYPAVKRHLEQFRDRLEPKPKDWSGGRWTGRKAGSYKWYEIQDSVDYWQTFEKPKIIWQDLSFHPRFCIEATGFYTNDLCFVLPVADTWLLTVLNSPLLWSYMWRNVIHGKDDVLRLKNIYTGKLPIAPPTDEARGEAEAAVRRMVEITRSEQEARRETLDWLRVEFGVEKPGQKLEDPAGLDADAFVEEVRKRRPKGTGRLTPGALRDLRSGYAELTNPVREARLEAALLERRLSDLVNQAYRLTPAEVDLLWSTAPPKMPKF